MASRDGAGQAPAMLVFDTMGREGDDFVLYARAFTTRRRMHVMFEKAYAKLDEVLEKKPNHKDALYYQGMIHLSVKSKRLYNVDKAIEKLAHAVLGCPAGRHAFTKQIERDIRRKYPKGKKPRMKRHVLPDFFCWEWLASREDGPSIDDLFEKSDEDDSWIMRHTTLCAWVQKHVRDASSAHEACVVGVALAMMTPKAADHILASLVQGDSLTVEWLAPDGETLAAECLEELRGLPIGDDNVTDGELATTAEELQQDIQAPPCGAEDLSQATLDELKSLLDYERSEREDLSTAMEKAAAGIRDQGWIPDQALVEHLKKRRLVLNQVARRIVQMGTDFSIDPGPMTTAEELHAVVQHIPEAGSNRDRCTEAMTLRWRT